MVHLDTRLCGSARSQCLGATYQVENFGGHGILAEALHQFCELDGFILYVLMCGFHGAKAGRVFAEK